MSTTVHVKNISPHSSEKAVRDFFSFCGKIKSLSVTPTSDGADAPKSATVTFEKETAAKTALLLDNTQLDGAQLSVSGAASLEDMAGTNTGDDQKGDHEVAQEDKPRSRILAEMLARGYKVGDSAIQRGLALDQAHGFSSRFTRALKSFDEKYKASDKAHSLDTKYGVSDKAATGWQSMYSYFDRAMGTPSGQKLRAFYEAGTKQVADVHKEALHLAGLQDKYGQSHAGGSAGGAEKGEKVEVEQVPGTDRTKCNCDSESGNCPCPPGKCACANCAKNPEATQAPSAAAHTALDSEKPSTFET